MIFGGTITRSLLTGSVGWLVLVSPGFAGELSQQQIIEKLMPHMPTPPVAEKIVKRSLTTAPVVDPAPAVGGTHQALVDSLHHRGNRPLTASERTEIAEWTSERPAVDLQIYFDYNSSAISPKAVPQLTSLGNALSSPELKNALVSINGHTDGKGNDLSNQKLSERRAESIKRYLLDHFALTADVTIGYGKQKLKDPAHPMAPGESPRRNRQLGDPGAGAELTGKSPRRRGPRSLQCGLGLPAGFNT
jgi:outer membrane protein OmpA-like peptidoglycan-associated protein